MNSLDIVVAFGGGIFGAAVGALAAFEFVGLLVIAMTVVQIITGASSDFITFPFGLFGPHTGGFAAGVAATAYAAKKGKLGSGRDITAGLSGLAAYDVLLVGGVFGAVGYIIAWGLNQIPAFPSGNAWTDTVALTVVISGVVSRLVFGKTGLFGKPEQGIRHCYPPQDKCWIPYHSRIPQLSVLGLGIGLMGQLFMPEVWRQRRAAGVWYFRVLTDFPAFQYSGTGVTSYFAACRVGSGAIR